MGSREQHRNENGVRVRVRVGYRLGSLDLDMDTRIAASGCRLGLIDGWIDGLID